MLVLTGALALGTAACADTRPTVVSDGPLQRAKTTSGVASEADRPGSAGVPGRYVAHCATEAEGGHHPGFTSFSDGSNGTTDYCGRRFYVGVQPAPGAVYVPDGQDGTTAPGSSPSATAGTWTPSQPRSDSPHGSPWEPTVPGGTPVSSVAVPTGTTAPSVPETSVPPVPGTSVPGTTEPSVPGTTVPGTTEPSVPGTSVPGTSVPGGSGAGTSVPTAGPGVPGGGTTAVVVPPTTVVEAPAAATSVPTAAPTTTHASVQQTGPDPAGTPAGIEGEPAR